MLILQLGSQQKERKKKPSMTFFSNPVLGEIADKGVSCERTRYLRSHIFTDIKDLRRCLVLFCFSLVIISIDVHVEVKIKCRTSLHCKHFVTLLNVSCMLILYYQLLCFSKWKLQHMYSGVS